MKKILIGVSSGIACYKAYDVCSGLKKMGYDVTVMMTKNTTKLISPNIFQILTGNKVYVDIFDESDLKVSHIELVKKMDLIAVIPATYNIIGKLANGIADDFITTTLAAADFKKVCLFPAMNTRMYENPIFKENLNKLSKYGYHIIEPSSGLLACGDIGKGKLPSIEDIIDEIVFRLNYNPILENKNVLITAGGTKEKIDPVRYISNSSSGKMGYALAKELACLGANVTLISTNKELKVPKGVENIFYVSSANEMFDIVMKLSKSQDYIFKVAAVSDFKIKNYSNEKIKKNSLKNLTLELEFNKDILLELSKINPRPFKLIGFAAESNNIKENALNKLKNKNLDYIVLNDISKENIGFNSDYNKVYIFNKEFEEFEIDINTKENIAKSIINYIINKK